MRYVLNDYHAHSCEEPMVQALIGITKEMSQLLKNEKLSTRQKLVRDLSNFKKDYPITINELKKVKQFLKGVELCLSLNHQRNIKDIPWLKESVHENVANMPHMLHEESFQYYTWLGRTYRGFGEIIEIGCWMGATSFLLANGLSKNTISKEKKIHVIDSFVWNDEMKLYCNHKDLVSLKTGDNFIKHFRNYTAKYHELITAHKHTYKCYEPMKGIQDKKHVVGTTKPIEYLIQDIAPDYEFNKYIWDLYSTYFLDNKTLIIYGQYGNFSANSLRRFVSEHSQHLIPIHKVQGNVKAFLYRK